MATNNQIWLDGCKSCSFNTATSPDVFCSDEEEYIDSKDGEPVCRYNPRAIKVHNSTQQREGELQDMESEIIELKEIICRAYIALSEAEMYASTPTIRASVLECHDISMKHIQDSEVSDGLTGGSAE